MMRFLRLLRFLYLAPCVLLSNLVFAEASKPNIVLIMVDDMGYGDPKCYNASSQIPTPNFDTLAREGMRFTDAHAPGPLCHLSRYGLLTGRYPFRADVKKWPRQAVIEPGQATLATMLRDAGYTTAMVGKWHLGFNENGYGAPLPGGPTDCGFDRFFGIRASTDIPPYFYIRDDRAVEPPTATIEDHYTEGWSPIQGEFWRAGGIAPNLELQDVLPRFTEEACEVIQSQDKTSSASPFFLYLAFPAPHTPWLPAEPFVGKSKAGLYGDFMVMVDAMIGRVLTTLEQQGFKQDTLVIVTSDNGPVWYEADRNRLGHDSVAGLRGMKADAWEGGHRMPFIVRWPGKIEPGAVSSQLICFTDVLATLAELLDLKLADQAGPDSFSFLHSLMGKDNQDARQSIAMQTGSGLWTVRIGDWKLISGLGSGGFSKPSRVPPTDDGPKGQLYHLSADPAETNNLYRQYPEKVAELEQELNRLRTSEVTREIK
jgi:arylsulfatase A-like enzyme